MTLAKTVRILLPLSLITLAIGIGGLPGLLYLLVYIVATIPGWPVGRRLFGPTPAGWIAGALIGYGITALCIWVPFAARVPSLAAFIVTWALATAATWIWVPRGQPLVSLPEWSPAVTTALCGVLLLVPLLTSAPFLRIGEIDDAGNARYRAYFTADFVWHEALTSELSRFSFPPRNPYMAHRPLNYYWAYYLLPAAATSAVREHPDIESTLAVNALVTGTLFIGAIFVCAWSMLPRPGAVAAGVALTVTAASAEGLYATIDLLRRSRPLSRLRELNVDAVSAWFFQGLSIDGLPRSIWWNPQHSLACAFGLIALTIAARAPLSSVTSTGNGKRDTGNGQRVTGNGKRETGDGAWQRTAFAGTALGFALIMSPFPGGAMVLIYGVAVLWSAFAQPSQFVRTVLVQIAAIVPVALALGWDVYNRTFEGAGGAVAIGLSDAGRKSLGFVILLALGPVLVPAVGGSLVALARGWSRTLRPAIAGLVISLFLMFFVTLTLEPIWIGWRAGQVFLVTIPALVAASLAALHHRFGRLAAGALGALILVIGLPTTAIDVFNAQDTSNTAMGAGFRWTVVISPAEQEALRWIERNTPPDAIVQMAPGPRGRETWTLIPSFARRRMATGLPISLLRNPEYEERSARADRIFSSGNAEESSRMAHELRVDYLYAGPVEREAFGPGITALDARPDLFPVAFRNSETTVYAVK